LRLTFLGLFIITEYTSGVDDVPSECDLDDSTFDHVLENDAEDESGDQLIDKLLTTLKLT